MLSWKDSLRNSRKPINEGKKNTQHIKKNTPGPGEYNATFKKAQKRMLGGKIDIKVDRHIRSQVLGNEKLLWSHFEKRQNRYQYEKTTLKDGRSVVILGGLKRDVTIFNQMLRSYENYYFKELVELHNTLLKDVHDELNLLIRNADLETDEFVQKEVETITALHTILNNAECRMQAKGKAENKMLKKNAALFSQINNRDIYMSDDVRMVIDQDLTYVLRMASSFIQKADQLKGKKFYINSSNTALTFQEVQEKFEMLFKQQPKDILTSIIQSTTSSRNEKQETSLVIIQQNREEYYCFCENGQTVYSNLNETKDTRVNTIKRLKHKKFRIGSMSKFFTGVLINNIEKEIPRLRETKLQDIFKDEELQLMFGHKASCLKRAKNITLQQLMDQTTGIRSEKKSDKKYDFNKKKKGANTTTDELFLVCKSGFKFSFNKPKGKFQYSNFNATLAGTVLERVYERLKDKKSFASLMQTYIFSDEQFNMKDTSYSVPIAKERAKSFAQDGLEWKTGNYANSAFFDPSGHIWTSLHDLKQFFSVISKNRTLWSNFFNQKKEGKNYAQFAKLNTVNGEQTVGVDGGRDGFGSSAHVTADSRMVVAIGNGGAQDMDSLTQTMAAFNGLVPFSGDPTTATF